MQTDLRGDYIGFSFGGVHSSSLGIVRVSDGSRYTQNLLPSFSDRTANVAGGNGVYYFGTDYSQNQISLSIAFDCVEETQICDMRRLFAPDGTLKELWFDELPYKYVMAKVGTAPRLKYIVFDEIHLETGANNEIKQVKKRVYKGEGTIQFNVFSPFARSRIKYEKDMYEKQKGITSFEPGVDYYYLTSDSDSESQKFVKTTKETPTEGVGYYILKDEFKNKDEWLPSANLLVRKGSYDAPDDGTVLVYNPGDMATPCKIYFTKADFKTLENIQLQTANPEEVIFSLSFQKDKGLSENDNSNYVCIDSKTCLVEEVTRAGEESNYTYTSTGTLYNRYITSGNFFSIPIEPGGGTTQSILATSANIADIKYDYLYYT